MSSSTLIIFEGHHGTTGVLKETRAMLYAVDVHEVQGSLATSRVGEVCPRLAQKT